MLRSLISGSLAGAAVVGTAAMVEPDQGVPSVGSSGLRVVAQVAPTRVARPIHLDATYVAPPRPRSAAVGRLRIARLGIDAPVVPVGWDRDTMAVPNDPSTLGWFTPSARLNDLAGASLIAGHVSDTADRAGPLALLAKVGVGDIVEWHGIDGRAIRFRVGTIQRIPRTVGLPTSLFRVDGPHILRLITCTNRVTGPSGVHYADNLVVSAARE